MSKGYASKLIQNIDKGLCGDKEYLELYTETLDKTEKLAQLIKASNYAIIHTGQHLI